MAVFIAGILTCGSLSAGRIQVLAEEEAVESEIVAEKAISDELLREDYYRYAAILEPPFYDPDASDAWNYGAIGENIAHEITHSFDSSGSTYDENGNYNSWWTEADAEKFEELSQQVVYYYDTFTVDGLQVKESRP